MTTLPAGTRLGRYEIRSALGAGGMGQVYLAEDTELGRRVALKVLPSDMMADDVARKRLLREARAAATLDHPHICSVYEVGEADGRRFIAMQFVDGGTLDDRVKRASLPADEAIAIAADVADALADAHAHGVIHRDIKPSNVMLTARGQAVVVDFGLAKAGFGSEGARDDAATASVLSTPGAVLGTVPYMSPEQVRGEPLDGRSDIFSLGVVLYELLSGQRPFADKSAGAIASAILTREPPPLARFAPDLPAELERIVAKALRKDPDERYQTAKDLLIDLRALREERSFQAKLARSAPPSSPGRPAGGSARRGRMAAIALVAMLAVAMAGWFAWRTIRARRAAAELPRIEALAGATRYFEAYDAAAVVERELRGDQTLARLMPTISMTVSVKTDPPGARVHLRRFAPDPSGAIPPRSLIGVTPVANLRVARGKYVLAIEKEGYAPVERTVSGALLRMDALVVMPPPIRLELRLVPAGTMPARMVFVPGGEYRLSAWSRPTDARVRLDDYFVDKYEVSNAEYKEFIDAGGYAKPEFWTHPFLKDGKTLSFDEAMRVLTDRTGLPGPRGWSGQNIPEGKASHPVADVTWYEAAAYAAFRTKTLPSVFQWEKAARAGVAGVISSIMPWGVFYPGDTLAAHANFENNGTMPVVSSEFGMSPFGAYNMAGNVSEWTANDTSEGRVATGGAWGDPTYVFAQYAMLPGFYSSSKLGFRCARAAAGAIGDQGASRIEIKEEIPVYSASSQANLETWIARYRYERTPLDARVEETQDTPAWTRERITLAGADGERAIAYLYLPKHVAKPLQVVYFVPAGDVNQGLRSLPASMEDRVGPFIKAGRAAFGVVLKGYIERLRPADDVRPSPATVEYFDRIKNRITDLRRGLDYLESRQDVDASRIAFFGPSAGAQIGLILAAIETRYRAVVLVGAGLPNEYRSWIPEANPVNFAAHIRAPKIMVQGRYDEDTPLKTAAEPLFRLMPEPKRLVVYEGGHVPPVELTIRTIGPWLDEMLGRVRRE
jgi:formylglycine-generating enzyme required for sulfatase activity/dienelactone hydrolase/predicted Ser/Thr protein kinase